MPTHSHIVSAFFHCSSRIKYLQQYGLQIQYGLQNPNIYYAVF